MKHSNISSSLMGAKVAFMAVMAALIMPTQATALEKGCSLQASIEVDDSVSSNGLALGERTTFAVLVTEGESPYKYAWDLNADGLIDATDSSVETSFPRGFEQVIRLSVTDSAECTAQAEIVVSMNAPEILVESVGQAQEVCGDGDGVLEPGERGSIALAFQNSGSLGVSSAHSVFTRSVAVASKSVTGPDDFGYTAADSEEASCTFDYIDIAQESAEVAFLNSFGSEEADDGAASINLDGTGIPVYGERYFDVSMSINGYIAMDPDDGGGDFFTSCPLPSAPRIGPDAPRLYPYHDDLFLRANNQGAGYYQYFEACPRQGRGEDEACHIFQWERVDFGTGGNAGPGPRPEGDFSFQAIVYEGSGDVVYQYTGDDPVSGRDAAVGLQNGDATVGLQYSCQIPIIEPDSAVCITAPQASEPGPLLAEGIQLDTPALALGDLEAGAQTEVTLEFGLDQSFECGARFGFDLAGTTHAQGFLDNSAAQLAVVTAGGAAGICDSAQACPTESTAVVPDNGLYYEPGRPGNGVDAQLVGSNVALLWYTATADHYPIWYFLAGPYVDNQVITTLREFTFGGTFEAGDPSSFEVGSSVLTWTETDRLLFIWELNGERWGEQLELFRTSEGSTDAGLTAQWYNPDESGWGLAFNKQGETEIQTTYLYDDNGLPVWLLSGVTDEGGQSELKGYQWVHCPACPWTQARPSTAGPLIRAFEGADVIDLTVDLVLPAPMTGSWVRENIKLQKIN